MGSIDSDTLYGSLTLLILGALAEGPLHGLGIARHIERGSSDALAIGEGALYPALHRMAREGLIKGRWGVSESRRRARYYELTRAGRGRLDEEARRWAGHANAVGAVLGLEGGFRT